MFALNIMDLVRQLVLRQFFLVVTGNDVSFVIIAYFDLFHKKVSFL